MKLKGIKAFTIMLVIGTVLFQYTGQATQHNMNFDYPTYSNEQELIDTSDVIILGRVIKVNDPQKININKNKDQVIEMVYTVSDIEVLDVIKGNVNVGDTIKIKQPGGKYKKEIFNISGVNYFKKDSEYIYFLQGYEENNDIPYSTLNPTQGNVEVINDKVIVNTSNNLYNKEMKKDVFLSELKKSTKSTQK